MLGVIRICDDLEEIRVTWRTANILRWAGSGAGDAGSCARRGIDCDQALEGYAMLPAVPEIVDVDEALVWRATEVAEPNRGLVECASVIFELGLADLLRDRRSATRRSCTRGDGHPTSRKPPG